MRAVQYTPSETTSNKRNHSNNYECNSKPDAMSIADEMVVHSPKRESSSVIAFSLSLVFIISTAFDLFFDLESVFISP